MQSQFSKIKKRILVLDLERKLRTNLNFVLSCANYNGKSAYIIKKTHFFYLLDMKERIMFNTNEIPWHFLYSTCKISLVVCYGLLRLCLYIVYLFGAKICKFDSKRADSL